ncbi:MAG: single-stranded-DNA-specific exonuclease RecJ [candidate division WOR-3 bacterium]
MKFRWKFKEDKIYWRDILETFGINGVIARVLATRFSSIDEVRVFLDKDFNDIIPPEELPGVLDAGERLARAIRNDEPILVHGDYDTDGVTSLALLYRNLKRLGATRVVPYIPDRFSEGYGLSSAGVKKAAEEGISLIVTVDCGITAIEEASLARSLGIDLVVTDHHEPLKELPEALALVNPRLGDYPFRELAGVGVVFKLFLYLYQILRVDPKPLLWDLDLVALGTIADVAPIVGENRILAEYGIKVLSNTLKAGLKALAHTARVNGEVKPWHISYVLAPRLNAAGRLTSAYKSFELLITTSGAEALSLAQFLESENQRRQSIERGILTEAREILASQGDRMFMVADSEGWHEGVIGIVASRLSEQYNRPIALIARSRNGSSRGSARSIPGFHIQEALEELSYLFEDFGGHPMAAGFTIPNDAIEEFKARIEEIAAKRMTEIDMVPSVEIDTSVTFEEMSITFYRDYNRLTPFAFGNRAPIFLTRGARVRSVSQEGTALNIYADQGGVEALITFSNPHPAWASLNPGDLIDIVFKVEADTPIRRGTLLLRGLDLMPG